jgi:hypothetical protein
MSFEGYYRALCVDGHLSEWDIYGDCEPEACQCGKLLAWRELVDTTNGDGVETELEIAVPAVTQTCNLGHHHVIEPVRYRLRR